MLTPSAPAAPPFSLTFSHASHTNRLGMSYDLPSASAHACGSSLAVDRIRSPRRPRPLAPHPLRSAELHSYYGRVRQRARRRYSAPRGFRRLEISLSLRKAPQQCPGSPSRVPEKRLGRDHAACMPDAAWAIHGLPPGLSQGRDATLVSTSSDRFRHVNGRGLTPIAHLPDPHLTRSSRAFSHDVQHNGLQPMHLGRFEASPRRATPEGHPTSIASTAPHSAGPPSHNTSGLLRPCSQHLSYSTASSGLSSTSSLLQRSCSHQLANLEPRREQVRPPA